MPMKFSVSALHQTTCIICLLASLPGLMACSDTTLTRFNVDEQLDETRVEGVGFVNILPLTLSELDANVEDQESFAREDYDYVTEIVMKSLALRITDTSDNPDRDSFEDGNEDNFDFVESMKLYIQALLNGEQRKEEIAFLDSSDPQIATSTRQLTLSTTGIDILKFVEAEDGYQVIIEATGNVPPDDVIFDGQVTYRVGVGFR